MPSPLPQRVVALALVLAGAATTPLPPPLRQPRGSLGMSALRLPDALGGEGLLDGSAGAQWWYFVGALRAAHDPSVHFSVQIEILRLTLLPAEPPVTLSLIGVADPRQHPNAFHWYEGIGGSTIDSPTWDSFSIRSDAGLGGAVPINYTFEGGLGVGLEQARYSLIARAKAETFTASSRRSVGDMNVALDLKLRDDRGVMLEGASGAVAYTYEYAQPALRVLEGSTLRLGNEVIEIAAGNLWNDMQVRNCNSLLDRRSSVCCAVWISMPCNMLAALCRLRSRVWHRRTTMLGWTLAASGGGTNGAEWLLLRLRLRLCLRLRLLLVELRRSCRQPTSGFQSCLMTTSACKSPRCGRCTHRSGAVARMSVAPRAPDTACS
jgi:hypothetical protein